MRDKYSILFHYSILNIGGAEKSVLRLTKLLCDKGWDVTLVLNVGGGALENLIDSRVKVIRLRAKEKGVLFKKAKGLSKILYIWDAFLYVFDMLISKIKSKMISSNHYDIAAVSLHGLSAEFVCKYVDATTKLHWIRNDLSQCDPDKKAINNIKKYKDCIDYYICVSQTAKDSLDDLFPHLKSKSVVIPNVIDAKQMRSLTKERIADIEDDKLLKVVTVCRLSDKAKGLLRMVKVHSRLDKEGIKFRWLVVGDGPDKNMMQEAINEAGLKDKMILLGSKENPFPYYYIADISATLSYYEGLCGAVNEAKVVGKAVLATEFSGIYDQIEHGKTGWIVSNDEDSIYEGLKLLLSDDKLRTELSNDDLPKVIMDDGYKIDILKSLVKGNC